MLTLRTKLRGLTILKTHSWDKLKLEQPIVQSDYSLKRKLLVIEVDTPSLFMVSGMLQKNSQNFYTSL